MYLTVDLLVRYSQILIIQEENMYSDSETTESFPTNPDFEFIEQIGNGGYGKVYLAYDLSLGNKVS